MADTIRELKERIYELERANAEIEGAVRRALRVRSLDEAQRFLRRAIEPYRNRWDQESLVAKLDEWVALHGRTPAALDWNPGQAKKYRLTDRVERFYEGEWPGYSTVMRHFDSWNAFIAAGGYETREVGETVEPGRGGSEPERFAHLPEWTGWELLRGYRERLGLSQDRLTELSGLSHNYVVAIERGRQTNPSVRVVLALAKPLGVRPGAFFE